MTTRETIEDSIAHAKAAVEMLREQIDRERNPELRGAMHSALCALGTASVALSLARVSAIIVEAADLAGVT